MERCHPDKGKKMKRERLNPISVLCPSCGDDITIALEYEDEPNKKVRSWEDDEEEDE